MHRLVLGLPLLSCLGCEGALSNPHPLQGAWAPSTYELASGESHPLRGQIFFTKERWSVVFFVKDEEGLPRRASAEGGRYELEGNALTFFHEYHFASGDALPGLAPTELTMQLSDPGKSISEATTVEWSGEVMTVSFPSGNKMRFVHLDAPT